MIPVQWGALPDWMRIVAREVNPRIGGYPFPEYDTAPADPARGFTYFDTTLSKVRTWDGSAWQAHW